MRRTTERPYTDADEKELALAFQDGDERAYEEIHERHAAQVEAVCRRMLGNRHDAQEATQEAFLRVYQALGGFNGRYQLRAWVMRIATNVCLDHLRARRRGAGDDRSLESLELDPADNGGDANPESEFLRGAERRRIGRVLGELPPLHRAAIVLRDLQGMSYCDIAVALGLSESQVKALIHRARKSFRRSWTSTAPVLLFPAKLLERIKRMVRPAKTDVTGTTGQGSAQMADLAASGSQLAASCTGMLQHCGQVVGERVAPMFVAALMGTAAGAAIASSPPSQPPPTIQSETAVDGPSKSVFGTRVVRANRQKSSSPTPSATRAPATVASASPQPQPSPASPSPSPSGSDGSKSPPGGSASPSPSPTPPPPEPTGFAFAFGHDRPYDGDPCCLRDTTVESERVLATQSSMTSVDQTVSGSATAAGRPAYGLWLQYSAGQDSLNGRFFLETSEGSYGYAASTPAGICDRTDWGGWSCRYKGTYSLSSRPGSKEVMPQRGTYTLELIVSAKRKAVLSTSFALVEAGS